MKLEYLPTGADMCPLIRIYEFDATEARRLHDTFCSLAAGALQQARLDEIFTVDGVDGCRLSFSIGSQDKGVLQSGKREFEIVLTALGWENTAGLTEPFCERCSTDYQWLMEHGNINLLLSPTGDW